MRIVRNIVLGAVAALGMALPAVAAERAIIVLDGSGSMWAQIDGKARITIARETLHEVLATLPDDLELGFMTYGHREKGNCDDIEMLVEPALGTADAITAAADAINPKGMTPISDAVRLAAEDLQFTEQKATVILITDGLETCEVDPCALASDLESRGIDFTTHVLGFGLSDEEGQQVACLAENTGGRYLSAEDGDALVSALTTTVAQVVQAEPEPAPEPEPEPVAEFNFTPTASLSEGGPDIEDGGPLNLTWQWYEVKADGSKGEWIGTDYYARFKGTLEPGDYIISAEYGNAAVEQPVTIVAGEVAATHFVLNAAMLKLHPLPSEGAEIDNDASTEIKLNGEYLAYDYGDVDAVVPAGSIEALVTIGEATVSRTYELKAGDTVDEDVVVGTGLVFFTTEYAPGSKVEDDIFMEIFDAKTALDGTRESIAYGYNGEQDFELPPGDYIMAYELDGTEGEIPFSVTTGERTDVPVMLDAGVLAITTPSDDYVEIRSPTKDIAGNVKSFDYGYGPEYQTTLKAGDYVVYSKKGDVESETPITIKAGERFELTIEAAAAAPAGGKKK
ncbi:Ca-activated chloride channel family protein [Devosia sp. YR412]|uniref:vWA domain-containing protein n=1 Tax=Devosia sp. YR412 TaxID=1881030 RepID=UPI0008B16F31|nr:VWA domain-containing protein [Devosia sp. YR412]SEP98067.1 Ca-activated chloride channel family protein [Devosia sp. YR412]